MNASVSAVTGWLPDNQASAIRAAVLVVALGGIAGLGAGATATTADAATSAVRKPVVQHPRPAARIARNTVRIAVRAGNESGDLRARLNGRQVGRDFSRPGNGLRVLRASVSHGLRWGDNVLRVQARTGATERRATVHFRVVPHHPLIGAGRDRRAPVGTSVRLNGRVRLFAARRRLNAESMRLSSRRRRLVSRVRASRGHARSRRPIGFIGSLRSAHRRLRSTERRLRSVRRRLRFARRGAARARWTVISAPVGSRYAKRGAHGAAAAPKTLPLTPIGPPVATVKVPIKRLGAANGPGARFRPNVLGRYRVRLTVGTGKRALTSTTSVDAVPRSGTAWIDTEDDGGGVPGIQIGDTDYEAPPLARDSGGSPGWSGVTPDGVHYVSTFQIVALDRATLAPVFNRTYGRCSTTDNTFRCRLVSGHDPVPASVRTDLDALDDSTMVIVRSHPGAAWEGPRDLSSLDAVLARIGFPSDAGLGVGVYAGGLSVIGVPGMAPGEASVNVVAGAGASGEMRGFLGADPNHHFGFMPAARVEFDTRAKSSCSSGTCTVTQTVGDRTATGTIRDGQGGFLVSAFDSHTLKLEGSVVFATTDDRVASGHLAAVSGMSDFIERWANRRSVFAITSIRTPGLGAAPLTDPVPPQYQGAGRSDWARLATDVANIGGTRDEFNTSTASTESLYSLIAGPGVKPSEGIQISDGNGRLRGALVPDTLSEFEPTNAVADGPPAELLPQLIVRKPVTTWPLDDKPAAHRALGWIGAKVPFLGSSPRSAYWRQNIGLARSNELIGQLKAVDYKPGEGFSAAAFAAAKAELIKEVGWVGNVRDYLSALSAPQDKAGSDAWESATKLDDELTNELSDLKQKADVEFAWFDVASSLLGLVGGFSAFTQATEGFAKYVHVFSATTALSTTLFDKFWGGAPASGAQRTVQADKLATQIEQDAKRTQDAYQRMGDMIVSDPNKLAEVGRWAECNAAGGGCDGGRYDELALPAGAGQMAGAAATRAIDRVLYERLVPLAFPVWNTGVSVNPDPATNFGCRASFNNPFSEAPARAYTSVLISVDPGKPGTRDPKRANRWATYLAVARSGLTYGFPSKQILDRMYDPVSTSDDEQRGGLGISPQDFLPHATPVYEPGAGVVCGWDGF